MCRKNDVVFVKNEDGVSAGEVWCHADMNGVLVSVIACWELRIMHRGSRSAEWRQSNGDPQLFPTSDIVAVAVWMPLGEGIARTPLPSEWITRQRCGLLVKCCCWPTLKN